MKIAVGFDRSGPDDWDDAAAYVQEAERMGVHTAWSAEAWGFDAVTPLAYLAAKTSRIKLGSGIMQISARTPAMAAKRRALMPATRCASPPSFRAALSPLPKG